MCFIVCLFAAEVHGTENPLTKRPAIDTRMWQESAKRQHLNERKTKMKTNQLEDSQAQKVYQVRAKLFTFYLFIYFLKSENVKRTKWPVLILKIQTSLQHQVFDTGLHSLIQTQYKVIQWLTSWLLFTVYCSFREHGKVPSNKSAYEKQALAKCQ